MIERPVTVVKRRWSTSQAGTSTFPATVIDEDEYGVWFRTDPLTVHRNEHGAFVYIATTTWLGLAPRDGMWLAMFAGGNWKVDVCTPPTVTDDCIDFCDLEIDVVVGTYPALHELSIVDQDELDALGLPADLHAACERTAQEVHDLIDTRTEPFGPRLDERLRTTVVSDPLVDAGTVVRNGWIAPAFPSIRPQLRERFGWSDDDADRTVLGGAFGVVHALVVDGELVGSYAGDGATPVEGLETLAGLTVEAARRLR